MQCILNSPVHTVVKLLSGSEANDGVDDRCREHGGAAVDNGDDNGILFTVVTIGRDKNEETTHVRGALTRQAIPPFMC